MVINDVEYSYCYECKVNNVYSCLGKDLLEHANLIDLKVILSKVSFGDFLNAEVWYCYCDGYWKILCAACEGHFVSYDHGFILRRLGVQYG